MEHGSDHVTIETVFDTPSTAPIQPERLLLKNTPWQKINTRIARSLHSTPWGSSVQQKTDRLMYAVLEAVRALTPKAKPSPHAKRWWTADLTQLRQIYTYWRPTPARSDGQGERCHSWRTWPQAPQSNTMTRFGNKSWICVCYQKRLRLGF